MMLFIFFGMWIKNMVLSRVYFSFELGCSIFIAYLILIMIPSGPIVLIEDDNDDILTMQEALKDLNIGNEFVYFPNTILALKFLTETQQQPFLIICDVNMPFQNGLDFKQKIDDHPELKKKCIPFIFYSTSAKLEDVSKAFLQMSIQGFFKKATSYREILSDVTAIIEYWKKSKHPNCF